MLFKVSEDITIPTKPAYPFILLSKDGWNDWFKYRTMYNVFFCTGDGKSEFLGETKIADAEMANGQGSPTLPEEFERLGERYVSVGQSENYYENMRRVADALNEDLLSALRDVVAMPEAARPFENSRTYTESLLRSITPALVEKFTTIIKGGAKLSSFYFAHIFTDRYDEQKLPLTADLFFSVLPFSNPPTNIHILIGRNGVGKTTRLSDMAYSLLEINPPDKHDPGQFLFFDDDPFRSPPRKTG